MSDPFASLARAFHRPGSRLHRYNQVVAWSMIGLSLGLFLFELAAPAIWTAHPWLRRFDQGILLLFALELALRVLTWTPRGLDFYDLSATERMRMQVIGRLEYLLEPLNLIDLFAVLSLHPALRALRALRLLRLLRSVQLFQYGNPFLALARALHDNRHLFYFGQALVGLIILVGGLSIYLAEATVNPNLQTPADGMWWALVTLSTVGFGDITPLTLLGRVIGAALIVCGMFSMAFFAGTVGSTLISAVIGLRKEQFRMSRHIGHIVVMGYDPGSAMLLDLLARELPESEHEMVILSNRERPMEVPPRFSWVQGDPTKESELSKVRLEHASKAVVVASREESPQRADAITILTLFTIRSYLANRSTPKRRASPLYVVGEILDTENVHHARAAGADEVIESTRLGFSMMAHAVTSPGTAAIMASVADSDAQALYVDTWTPPAGASPVTFLDWRTLARTRTSALVIGFRDLHGDHINPPDSTPVPPEARLIYLADEPVLAAPLAPREG